MAAHCFLCSTVTCYLPFRNIHNKGKSKKEWQQKAVESLVFISQTCQLEQVVTHVFAFTRIWKESLRGTDLIFAHCLSFVHLCSTWEIVKKWNNPLQAVKHPQHRCSASYHIAPFCSLPPSIGISFCRVIIYRLDVILATGWAFIVTDVAQNASGNQPGAWALAPCGQWLGERVPWVFGATRCQGSARHPLGQREEKRKKWTT